MSLKIPSPGRLASDIDAGLDPCFVAIQNWANREMGGNGWYQLKRSDVASVLGDAGGTTFTINDEWGTSSRPGYVNFLRLGPALLLSFDILFTPSANTALIQVAFGQFAIRNISRAVGHDFANAATQMRLVRPSDIGVTTWSDNFTLLRVSKLDGTNWNAGVAAGIQGQIIGELSPLETTLT